MLSVPLLSYLLVDIWICQCMLGLQNVFIIWFYYKQHRPVLKNEVKKTTTWPPWPSARQTGPKWTTHSVSVKLCIKDILEYKQSTNKSPHHHPPATQHTFYVCFSFYKQRQWDDAIENVWVFFLYRLFGRASRQIQLCLLQICSSWISKSVFWMLSVFVCRENTKIKASISYKHLWDMRLFCNW